ncbi:hypothetical protein D8T40_21575 [Vibrio vulnificus]|nr:hypothetical protein D8T40_21575 [Vibrio vulnificus]
MFAVFLVVKVLCGKFSIACLRPLTRRYSARNYRHWSSVKNDRSN